jgi:hypothetical protein
MQGLIALSNIEVSAEDEARGREIIGRLERARKERLNA